MSQENIDHLITDLVNIIFNNIIAISKLTSRPQYLNKYTALWKL